ncbi:MAG: hypothetical protein ABSG49_01165 [Methanoregula sp.]|jgi:hypothetical protein
MVPHVSTPGKKPEFLHQKHKKNKKILSGKPQRQDKNLKITYCVHGVLIPCSEGRAGGIKV